MKIHPIAYAIPFFLLLMGIEYVVARYRKIMLYPLNDFSNNLSCGILEQVCSLPLKIYLIFSYQYLYEHHALLVIDPHSIISWGALWIGVDFFYYWFHRASHRINLLWIGHSVHHQSEEYNLSVSLRQGFFQTMFSWMVYLPLALLGFPTWMFVTVSLLNTLYQFWIHTPLIYRMGWFETIFNTPSHHRVHHGKNLNYIDKNYAGSLIIWDKMFGTFEQEGEVAIYGTTEPLNNWNPFYANIKVVADILFYGKFLNSKKKRALLFFRPPEWIVDALGKNNFLNYQKINHACITSYPKFYIFLNVLVAIISYISYLIIFYQSKLAAGLLGVFILATLFQIGFTLNYGISRFQKLYDALRAFLLFGVFFVQEDIRHGLLYCILFYATNYLSQMNFQKNFVAAFLKTKVLYSRTTSFFNSLKAIK